MSLDSLQALLVEQLQDIYYAEKHLVKALPKMAKAADAPALKTAFTEHARQTEEHVSRLERAFESLGVAAKAKKCPAIEGLIQEAAEMMEEEGPPAVIDAGLIASAERVEYYEMAAYGNVRRLAEALGHDSVVALLDATLGEEQAADRLLVSISTGAVVPAALKAEKYVKKVADAEDKEDEGAKARKLAKAFREHGHGHMR
jgi:ferritin-like metal-binding protein YciE